MKVGPPPSQFDGEGEPQRGFSEEPKPRPEPVISEPIEDACDEEIADEGEEIEVEAGGAGELQVMLGCGRRVGTGPEGPVY